MVAACQGKHATPLANEVRSVTQADYSRNSAGTYSKFDTAEISADGRRVTMGWRNHEYVQSAAPVARIRVFSGHSEFYKPLAVVQISDKPGKALPIDLNAIEAAAIAATVQPVEVLA